ncbi:MAG: CoB--CoM heterodisulfide reductase iron-sulfur subunit A family protein, partial [Theionarchaea archaeon]|nr:CoB--CoM heterodisulfide reductase iron-sulfur subunit A family protein [Theionarchaea archaeon]
MVGSVMVVGGGIAGMQAALDLADSGFRVYVVDKKPTIGGVMAQLDKTFPTLDCAMCIMAPKLVATGRHHNVTLLTNTDIIDVEGSPGDFAVTVRVRPRYVNAEKCTGCGVCTQYCPVEAANAYDGSLILRGGVYVDYPQAVPLVYAIDKDTCIGCGLCEKLCQAKAIEYDQEEIVDKVRVGSIILAAGFDEFEPDVKKEYGYGRFKNVVTATEFERILSASGPFGGHVVRPSDGEIPERVAFLQCVGSRDEKSNKYCSAVCCMYATKEAIIAREHNPALESTIFFMDMRTYGKGFEEFYNRAQSDYGLRYIRSRIPNIEEDSDQNLILTYETEDGKIQKEKFDMVVLSVGLEPPRSNEELSRIFGVPLNEYGFLDWKIFEPLRTKEGVYTCGVFSGPKDIPDTVAQASGAAAMASAIISSERGTLVEEKVYPEEISIEGEPRIGVFVCWCGINIGGTVNVPEVMEYAATLPHVVFADQNLYTCSQDTQEKIKQAVKEHNLNRVIVASCTPRTHEPLFQSTIREAGLNPYLFEMTNIRDQCSWVHMHTPEEATSKAKDLVRMAVAKANLLEPLHSSSVDVVQSGLVIGG